MPIGTSVYEVKHLLKKCDETGELKKVRKYKFLAELDEKNQMVRVVKGGVASKGKLSQPKLTFIRESD